MIFDDWFDSTGLERGFEDSIYEAAKQAFKTGYLEGHNDGYDSAMTYRDNLEWARNQEDTL